MEHPNKLYFSLADIAKKAKGIILGHIG